jgi:hypothetical protein
MEWIYKKIWELKSKALTVENKVRIQMLQQLLDNPKESNTSTAIASEKKDKNNSANIRIENSTKNKEDSSKDTEENIDTFLFNRYNR